MPTRRSQAVSPPPARLRVPRTQAAASIQARITEGRDLRERPITGEEELKGAREAYYNWDDFNDALLLRLFDSEAEQKAYAGSPSAFFIGGDPPLGAKIKDYRDDVHEKLRRLESLLAKLPVIEEVPAGSPTSARDAGAANRHVFIVHGRDNELRQSVARFIEHLDLTAIILGEQPGMGLTIIEKFERNAADVGYAVVLLSPDDVGKLDGSANDEQKRARQNVLFELGYFVGKLGRGKVCLLKRGDLEMPSDLAGVEYVSFDEMGAWHLTVAREMKAAKLDVDLNKAFS